MMVAVHRCREGLGAAPGTVYAFWIDKDRLLRDGKEMSQEVFCERAVKRDKTLEACPLETRLIAPSHPILAGHLGVERSHVVSFLLRLAFFA
jgi:hypothetical protein